MKVRKFDDALFAQSYLSIVQILTKLADPTFLFAELGRGSGKTTHILAPRIDRVQDSMPGACLVLAASTYKSIIDNILPGLMEYFFEHYERGFYYEIGKEPPRHFAPCYTFIDNWKHTISFVNGCVIQFVSCDRPESMLGKNAAHLFVDELLRIPETKFVERIIPALRSDRSKFGHSPYFMGITGISSTPNFETDEDWWTKYEQNMDVELMECIQDISYQIDVRKANLIKCQAALDIEGAKKAELFINRWTERVNELKRGQTYYLRASSFSNIKILGIDYIENQIKSIKDEDALNTSIFAIRKNRVKELFFGKFSKEHIFSDSYRYDRIDNISADLVGSFKAEDLKHYDSKAPLYVGYDPGPFTSAVFAQKNMAQKTFKVIKDFCVIHPDQQPELADQITQFFGTARKNRTIFLHYDRAANQHDPKWRDYYPLVGDKSDTDAILLKKELEKRGWQVRLMSLGAPTIYYAQHYRLLSILFGNKEANRWNITIDGNECEATVSSIYHSPIKRHEGKILLDKSSEKELEYKDQRLYSTQVATALMYLLWGEFKNQLPESDHVGSFGFAGATFKN